ncbi:hypothetical protein IIA_05650 [Bacillus cereus VD014]|uniref:Uncharacterized protein n=1 Tax=Bacillus cereus (strain VD014) TaxID=1053223 RepID=A0A9W5K288_BACC8|nr:hypothetical protein IIA_05650 [Bacillus cereus VD014]
MARELRIVGCRWIGSLIRRLALLDCYQDCWLGLVIFELRVANTPKTVPNPSKEAQIHPHLLCSFAKIYKDVRVLENP